MNEQDDFLFHLDDPETEQVGLPNATAVLVLGIISIATAFYFGFPGVIFGAIALLLAKKDRMLFNSSPETYTSSSYRSSGNGRVCAIVGLSLGSLFLLLIILDYFLQGKIY